MKKLLDTCTRELMDTAPKIMQAIRVEMRRGRGSDLSIPQFRTLLFIRRNPDSSLSDIANHLGLTLPSVSKLVDGLVKQQLVTRQESASDRRRCALVLTQNGESIVSSSSATAQENLAALLKGLSNNELQIIQQAMELLQPLFISQNKQTSKG